MGGLSSNWDARNIKKRIMLDFYLLKLSEYLHVLNNLRTSIESITSPFYFNHLNSFMWEK